MEIKDLISQAGGKAFALSGSNFDERIITELFSRFVPERQYVENGETILRSPWSAVSEVFRNLKAVEEQNFSAAKNQTSFNKMHYEAWFDKDVFIDADLDAFLAHLSDYKIIENYTRKDDAQKVTVSFIYVDTLLIRLINQFSEKTTPANDFAHCQLRFEPLINEFDSKASAKITVFRKSFENVAFAAEEDDPQFVKDKLELLRFLASEEYGLIGGLEENGLFVSFVVKDYESMQLLKTQGKLFELFLYHALQKSNLFDDVQTSLHLIWDASAHDKDTILRKNLHADNQIGYQNYKNKKKELEKDFENKVYNSIDKKNEIDIVMSRGENLYFVSCKMTQKLEAKFRTEAHEVARRFNATPILAVTKNMSSDDKKIQDYLDAARTEGVSVIGLETVLDDEQLYRVIEKLQEGYLVHGKDYCEKDTDNSAYTESVDRSIASEEENEHSHADNTEAYEELLRKSDEILALFQAHFQESAKEQPPKAELPVANPKKSFSMQDDISAAIFNSVVDHPVYGDERQFVRIREHGKKEWSRSMAVKAGKQYDVEILYRNDAAEKYNEREQKNRGVALQTRLAIDLPPYVRSSRTDKLNVKITAENVTNSCEDSIQLNNPETKLLYLHYIAGSCKISNHWKTNGEILEGTVFRYTTGTYLGVNALNGVVLGGDPYSGHVSFVFEVSDKSVLPSNQTQPQQAKEPDNGDIYEGDSEHGLPHGYGNMLYKCGDKYVGRFVQGSREGYGALKRSNGDVFTGKFKDNNWSNGAYYYKSTGIVYEGGFENGKKAGRGVYIFSNGSKLEGNFVDGELNGYCRRINCDGSSVEEYYLSGKVVDSDTFALTDISDPFFLVLKIENTLKTIKQKNYSFTTKKNILSVCTCINQLMATEEGKRCFLQRTDRIRDDLIISADKYSKEAVRSGDTSLYDIKRAINSVLKEMENCRLITGGWGPERHIFDGSEFVAFPTFNSQKDGFQIKNERSFVLITKRHGESNFNCGLQEITPGEYDIRIYYNNNAARSLENEDGCAINVKVSTYFPTVLKRSEKRNIGGVISSSNSSPKEVWAKSYISTSCEKLYLSYVQGTAIIHNQGALDGAHIPDEVFTQKGTLIGVDSLDGSIPAGPDAAGYIEYTIVAEEIVGTIKQEVSFDGINYKDSLDSPVDADIYFRLTISNRGNRALTNATIFGLLSEGLSLVPGSITLSANESGVYDPLPDAYHKNGLNLGRIGTGNTVNIFYKCHVNKDQNAGDTMICSANLVYDSETKEGDRKSSVTIIHIAKLANTPWGPSRKTFSWNNPAPYATFNSIMDNPGVGDERYFVRIQEANANDKFRDELKVASGKIYEVYIYYMNDASPSLPDTPEGIARDVRVNSLYPRIVTATKKYTVNATISSSNALPGSVWAGAYLTADEDIILEYVPNSLILHSYTKTHGQLLNAEEFFSKNGTLIPIHADQPGVITSKNGECCGHITYCLKARKRFAPADITNQFGPERKLFSWSQRANYAVFNSIVDNPSWGDERYFVKIREIIEAEDVPFSSACIKLKKGSLYEVAIYYHNNSDPETVGGKVVGISKPTMVQAKFPAVVLAGQTKFVSAIISGRTKPSEVWARVAVIADESVVLRYVKNTALFHNTGLLNGHGVDPDYLFGSGAYLGYNKVSGLLPGGDQNAGTISFRLFVDSLDENDCLYEYFTRK